MRLARLVVSTLVACAISGSAHAQQLPSGVGATDITLFARLLAMTDTRTLDMPLVEQGLTSRWNTLREAAALAIGQIGPEKGLSGAPRLRGLLTDPDVRVAANAAYALGLLRDTASVPALRTAMGSNHEVAREAAWALGEIGAPARAAITSGLKQHVGADVTIQLLLAAAKLRPLPVSDIKPFLAASNRSVVWAASYAIARGRSPAGVGALIDLAASPNFRKASPVSAGPSSDAGPYTDAASAGQRVRAEIARALSKSATGDSLGDRAVAVLGRLAADPDPHVRINALRSLATYGTSARATLTAATRDRDPNVRVAAAQAFGTVLVAGSDYFNALWAADTSLVYRASLLASAARAGLRPPQLSEWATNRDWRFRAAVANAAGDSVDRSFALRRAAGLTRDPDPRVREAAFAAIVPPGGMPLEDSVHAMLVTGLRDPDFYVRATILGALADRPSAVDLPAVLASYAQADRDSANDARLAALQYVSALWKKDSSALGPALRDSLARIAVPTDPLERAAGKSVSMWSRWATVPANARPLSWYEDVVKTIVIPTSTGKTINATIHTVRGPIRLELFGADAPVTVGNFLSLARSGYYRNTRFHRVVPNFVAQDGDPRDDGNGGPGYAIRDEMNRHRYERGAVGMALSGPDTGGSQYFITHSPQPHLDGHYTVFGRVLRGYDVLDRIVQGDLITSVEPQ